MAAHGYVNAEGATATDLLLRVHSLLGVHAERCGGTLYGSAVDIALAWFPSVAAALDAGFALQDEVEQARPPGHQHHKLLALGVSFGTLVALQDGRVLGAPAARAMRLAMLAGPTGSVFIDQKALGSELPAGLGRSEAKRSLQDLIGFRFHHLADYSPGRPR